MGSDSATGCFGCAAQALSNKAIVVKISFFEQAVIGA